MSLLILFCKLAIIGFVIRLIILLICIILEALW